MSLGGREEGREALEEGKVEVVALGVLVDERLVDFAALVVLALDEEESASFFCSRRGSTGVAIGGGDSTTTGQSLIKRSN